MPEEIAVPEAVQQTSPTSEEFTFPQTEQHISPASEEFTVPETDQQTQHIRHTTAAETFRPRRSIRAAGGRGGS